MTPQRELLSEQVVAQTTLATREILGAYRQAIAQRDGRRPSESSVVNQALRRALPLLLADIGINFEWPVVSTPIPTGQEGG